MIWLVHTPWKKTLCSFCPRCGSGSLTSSGCWTSTKMAGYEKNHGISRDFIWFQLCSHRLQQVWIEWFTQGFLAFPDFPDFTQLQLGQELRVLNVGRWQTDSGHLMEMVKDAYKRGRLGTWGTWGISCGILPWWWWWWWWFKVPSFCFSWRSALSGIRKQFADTRWLLLENIELESDIHLPLDCFLTSILETLAASHLFDLILFGRQLQSLSTLYQFRSKHWRSRNKSQQVVISSCVPCHSMSFHVGVQQRSQVLSPWSSRRPVVPSSEEGPEYFDREKGSALPGDLRFTFFHRSSPVMFHLFTTVK